MRAEAPEGPAGVVFLQRAEEGRKIGGIDFPPAHEEVSKDFCRLIDVFVARNPRGTEDMQCTRLSCLRRTALSLAQKATIQPALELRNVHLSPAYLAEQKQVEQKQPGRMERMRRFVGRVMNADKYRKMALGYLVYENIVDNLNYDAFYKDFSMPDTMFSWFLVTELHVWMAMVRYMVEGSGGKLVRNNLVECMWQDVQLRMSKLGHIPFNIKQKQLNELSDQFNAAVIGYDEGIQSDDKVLAGALWRRFFGMETNDPEQLETLVAFVRKQIHVLDNTPTQEILTNPRLKWLDLRSVR